MKSEETNRPDFYFWREGKGKTYLQFILGTNVQVCTNCTSPPYGKHDTESFTCLAPVCHSMPSFHESFQ
jgi:hypothetical protein